ncbi:MAG: YlbF family regulator [Acutalibacteraceae bacterium]
MDTKDMDIIDLAREIGRKLQQDENYIKFQLAKQATDEDAELQDLIGEFNLKRMAINNEASKENRSEEKLQQLNQELRSVYAKIMTNENMINYNDSKEAVDTILARVSAIIQKSSEGEDPETADYTPSCSGSCATCGGCH